MFGAARLEKIKEIVKEKKQIDVSTLSSILSVTEVTVRKDLEKLEQEGFIVKTHGGAIFNDKNVPEMKQNESLNANNIELYEEKIMIGEIASYMIKDKDSIFLGSGTTCYCIAKALRENRNIKINIVTNNLSIANILCDINNINVILTGGNLSGQTMALTGEMVQKTLEGIFVDKAFISVSGVHISNGFTVSSTEEMNVYRTVMNISKELIIVADYSKFDRTSFIKLGAANIAKRIITNENIPIEYKAHFFEQEIQIFTSYEID